MPLGGFIFIFSGSWVNVIKGIEWLTFIKLDITICRYFVVIIYFRLFIVNWECKFNSSQKKKTEVNICVF